MNEKQQVENLKEFVLGKMKIANNYDESKLLIQIYEKVKRLELSMNSRDQILNIFVMNPN